MIYFEEGIKWNEHYVLFILAFKGNSSIFDFPLGITVLSELVNDLVYSKCSVLENTNERNFNFGIIRPGVLRKPEGIIET